MHTINLGILYTCNAASVRLGKQLPATLTLSVLFPSLVLLQCCNKSSSKANVLEGEWQLRILLCEDLGYFGGGTFEQQLDRAYKDFLAYCIRHKIQHSQPPFLPKMVFWPKPVS